MLVAADSNGQFVPLAEAEFKTAAKAEGWNQTDGVTTTFTPQGTGEDINISSACPPGVAGTVTFTTVAGDDAGKVIGPTP